MSSKQNILKEDEEDIINDFQNHFTNVPFNASLELSRCEDTCCGCLRVHCPFCSVSCYKPQRPARVRDHINQTHFKHALLHREKNVLMVKCYKQCETKPGHFHCPYCPKQLLKKAGFLYHLQKHLRNQGKSELLVQVPNFKQPEHILFDGNVIKLCSKPCDGSLGKHYHCSLCKSKTFEEMGPLSDHLWRCRELVACGTAPPQVKKKKTDTLWAENTAIKAAAPKAAERYGDQCHISVVRNMGDLPMDRCEVVGCCRHRFHCCLCPEEKFKPTFQSHIQEHYLSHWNNRVLCGVYSCVVCYQDCLPQFGRFAFHFHCPKCGIVRRRKERFIKHLQECVGEDMERDTEECGFELTAANIDSIDDPDLVSHVAVESGLETRIDNSSSLKHEGDTDQAPTELSKSDAKKIWEVFDMVTAHVSSEFISELSGFCPLEELFQEVGTRSGVKVTEKNSGYEVCGTFDNVHLAKQILREKLPAGMRRSMETVYSGKIQQDSSLSPTINGNSTSQTPDHSPLRPSLNSATGENLQHDEVLEEETEQNISNVQSNYGQSLTEQEPNVFRKIPTALEVLSSAVEIIKNEELGSENETANLPTTRSSRKRKQTKILAKSSPEKKAKRKDEISTPQASGEKRSRNKPVEELTPRRYSTRGNKVDFSLLATGRRKKEPKTIPKVSAEASKEVNAKSIGHVGSTNSSAQSVEHVDDKEEESVQGSEDLTLTNNDEEDIEKESLGSEDIEKESLGSEDIVETNTEQDYIEKQSKNQTSKTKINFGSMAVIPNVTFQMQSTKMSKQLLGGSKESEASEVKRQYFCVICETETDSFYDMVRHYSTKHGISEDLHCDKCSVICLSDEKKQEHLAGHENGKEVDENHACNLCDFVSMDFSEVTDHIITVHKTDCIRCDVCEREFSKHKSLDIHLSLKHGPRLPTVPLIEKSKTKCSTCTFEAASFSELTSHLVDVHKIVSPTRCNVCERVFDSTDGLEGHLKKQHGPMEEHLIPNRCSQCGLLCKNRHVLNQHQIFLHNKSHRIKKDISLECKTCYFQAKSEAEIREHQAEHRRGNLKCPHCDAVYKNRPNLQFHIQLEHKKDQTVSCHICGQLFRHKRYIRSHMKRHSGKKTFSCEVCQKDFYDKSTLVAHMNTHKDVSERSYRFICSYCGSGYNSKSNFTDHLNKHTGEKPYSCGICDKRFSYRSQLKQHQVYIHTKERPFKCDHCDRAFKLKVRLNQHMVSHTGISKYTCDICSRPFGTFTALRNHVAKCKAGLIKKPQVLLQGDVVLATESIVEMPLDSYVVVNDHDGVHDLQQLTEGHEVTVHQPEVYACSVCKEEFEQYHLAVEHINTAHEDAWTDGHTEAAAETDMTLSDMTASTFLVSNDTFVTSDAVSHTDTLVEGEEVAAVADSVSSDAQVIIDQTGP